MRAQLWRTGRLRQNFSAATVNLDRRPIPTHIDPSNPFSPDANHAGRPLLGRPRLNDQKWSTRMVLLTTTLIGSIMYVVGINVQLKKAEGSGDEEVLLAEPRPTQDDYKAALDQLKSILPRECISWDMDDLIYHGTTAWSYHVPDCLPGAVLYPKSTDDVVKIVKVAKKYSIPLVAFSGGTSLEGHFNAPSHTGRHDESNLKWHPGQLEPGLSFTIDFSKHMNKIIALHESDLDVVVQPGISYDQLNSELLCSTGNQKLFFPVDPGPGAQIGGMIGTGCSGTNAVKYGTMRENVINLTVVLPSGEVIKTRQRAKKCSAGPDLGKLFIGSEGTLGLVTEVTLKLQPCLPTSVGVSHFPDIESATKTVLDLIQSGISLACIELLDDEMMKAINQGMGEKAWVEKPSLFLKFTGTPAHIQMDQQMTSSIIKNHGGSKVTMAKSDVEAQEIWQARKNALWSSLDSAPGQKAWTTDVCVPISSLPKLILKTRKILDSHGLKATLLGHVGDGNFHCIILMKDEEDLAKARDCVDSMIYLAQDLDGTCTGEHGVGLGKMNHLERELGTGTLNLLRLVKKTLDPKNIMNPGKLIPPPKKA